MLCQAWFLNLVVISQNYDRDYDCILILKIELFLLKWIICCWNMSPGAFIVLSSKICLHQISRSHSLTFLHKFSLFLTFLRPYGFYCKSISASVNIFWRYTINPWGLIELETPGYRKFIPPMFYEELLALFYKKQLNNFWSGKFLKCSSIFSLKSGLVLGCPQVRFQNATLLNQPG